ncbi:MAG: hypothetical protein COB67_12980 [SAR324 cluster bacterium]|uniref:YgjP-like metallopeptidase domain-containing protein n=1 Tax=SAR324 cluster bacterium TaxID=2024889 RepID=A0A2A4SQ21_9DELT|nr:MAG: hypothetical protein COB67_12980 [SAR324 cluster bacterium]
MDLNRSDCSPEYIETKGYIAEVIRTPRKKTATIKVEAGVVTIVVPENMESTRISKVLTAKHRWILEKLVLQKEALFSRDKQYISGEAFSYLGRNYRLKIQNGPFTPVKLKHGQLTTTQPEGNQDAHRIRKALLLWYQEHAKIKLTEKAKRYARILEVIPTAIGIKTFKSRWGSCSAEGQIDFNWKIIMAPNRIVDYIVVHELCHLKHHDHSPRFWKEVEQVIPNYTECKEWLKVNSTRLVV